MTAENKRAFKGFCFKNNAKTFLPRHKDFKEGRWKQKKNVEKNFIGWFSRAQLLLGDLKPATA